MNIHLDVLRYLKEHDITLVKAAEATGVAQQNIKKSIGNNPKTSTLLALAKGLGVDPREFFYDLDKEGEEGANMDLDNKNSLGEADAAKEGSTGKNDTTTDAQSSDTSSPDSASGEDEVKSFGEQTIVNTTTFCPHCGAKVRVGVVLLPE